MMDRKLLAKLSQCAWKVLNLYLTQAVPYDDAKVGAAIAVQSFGLRLVGQAYGSESDFQNFNSHLHVICTDGCFYGPASAGFKTCPAPKAKDLEEPFRHEVFKMLKVEGKINDVVIENMMNWPPARRAYASESATADSTCIAAMPSGPIMKKVLKI